MHFTRCSLFEAKSLILVVKPLVTHTVRSLKNTLISTTWKLSNYGLDAGKYKPEKTLYLDTFHAVHFLEKPLHLLYMKVKFTAIFTTEMINNINWTIFQTICNLSPLSVNFTKRPITLKQFVGKLPTNFLSVFGHFVGLALKELV